MIELVNIFFTIFCLLIIFNLPFNFSVLKKKFVGLNLTYTDSLLLNIIFISNLLLFFSFFQINLTYLFVFLIFSSITVLVKNYKLNYLLLRKNYIIALVFLTLIYSMSVAIAKSGYLEWDGLAHWIIKAQVFFNNGKYEDLKNVPFNYYPHLGPYIWAFFWDNSFLKYEYSGRIFYIFIFLLTIFSMVSRILIRFNLIEKVIILLIFTYLATTFYLFGGYQEYLIFFCFFCFSYFLVYLNKNNIFYKKNLFPELILLLIVNIMFWTKQEGFFYSIILSFIYLFFIRRVLIYKLIYFSLFLSIFFLFLYIKIYYFEAVNFNEKIINEELYKNLDIKYLTIKILLISKYMIISFFKYPIWLLIFIAFFLLKKNTDFFRKNYFFFPAILILFSFIFAIFLQTSMDLNFLLPVTLNRLIFAISGFFIILPVEYLSKLKK